MQLLTSEAILLDVIDLHESDRIATFLTREWGKKRGVARGARRKHSRFAGQLQPLAKLRMTWSEKEGRDLVRISSADLLRSADPLQHDLEGILLGCYLADHVAEFAQENEDCETYYRLLDATLEALMSGVDPQLAARYFEAWMLRIGGIFPPPDECPECGRDLAPGAHLPASGETLLCLDCAAIRPAGLAVAPPTIAFLRCIGRRGPRALAGDPPSPGTLEELERLCAAIRRAFLQRELRSYRVMRDTLGLGNVN